MALLPSIRRLLRLCNREHRLLLVRLRLLRHKERSCSDCQGRTKIPVMKMSSLGVSIKNPQRDQVSQNTTTTYVPKVQQPEEDFMFNDRDLNYYWQEYAGQLPKEQDALAKRMQMLRPALLNNSTTFEVVVDNEFAAKDFTALIPELQDYLRGRLKNSKVMMTVRVSEATETVRPVGRREIPDDGSKESGIDATER